LSGSALSPGFHFAIVWLSLGYHSVIARLSPGYSRAKFKESGNILHIFNFPLENSLFSIIITQIALGNVINPAAF
jgi:hypothetical protein